MKKELEQYAAFAKFLREALGEGYAVTLLDAEELKAGCTVENRELAAASAESVPDYGVLHDILNSTELKKRDYLCSYFETGDGRAGQKHSMFYIRDEKGEIVGGLSIREKENGRVTVREIVNELLGPQPELLSDAGAKKRRPAMSASQRIGEEVDELVRERIADIWERHKVPGERMKKAEKVAFVSELLETGIFRMKGAPVLVSEVTGISEASLYRYLSEAL